MELASLVQMESLRLGTYKIYFFLYTLAFILSINATVKFSRAINQIDNQKKNLVLCQLFFVGF